jgi:carbon storage regulator CsrA
MLVLSCKVGQRIVLPTIEAEIAIVAIKGKSARLGITAPAEVVVNRVEVCRRATAEPAEREA